MNGARSAIPQPQVCVGAIEMKRGKELCDCETFIDTTDVGVASTSARIESAKVHTNSSAGSSCRSAMWWERTHKCSGRSRARNSDPIGSNALMASSRWPVWAIETAAKMHRMRRSGSVKSAVSGGGCSAAAAVCSQQEAFARDLILDTLFSTLDDERHPPIPTYWRDDLAANPTRALG